MVDVLLTSEDLTVLGGPSSVSVDVDFGPTGERGSRIYAIDGKPSVASLPSDLKYYDIAINTLTSDSEYLFMYQYLESGGVGTWQPLVDINPNTYSSNGTYGFANGSLTIPISVGLIAPQIPTGTLSAEDFNIQYSILNTGKPLSSHISIGAINSNNELPITISAIEYTASSTPGQQGTWSDLTGEKTIHLFITVV